MKMLDEGHALDLLRKVVAEKGEDFIYVDPMGGRTECAYFHGKEPGCIVGHVLAHVGVTGEDVATAYCNTGFGVEAMSRVMNRRGVLSITPEAQEVLIAAQKEQDAGEPWGYALRRAEVVFHHSGTKG